MQNHAQTMRRQEAIPLLVALVLPALLSATMLGCGDNEAAADLGQEFELMVYDPQGATEISTLHAARLPSLQGHTLCLLSDFMWEADRTMPLIRDNLVQRYPNAQLVPAEELPDIYHVDLDRLEEAVNQAGCEGAVVGNAG